MHQVEPADGNREVTTPWSARPATQLGRQAARQLYRTMRSYIIGNIRSIFIGDSGAF
eukprot:COSAG02_NODE_463_length_21833_cov_11.529539_23_plen_57_part_00